MRKRLSAVLVLLSLVLLGTAVPSRAATLSKGVVTFSYSKEVDSYKADVTGDGKKDLVEWIQKGNKETLQVNGEKVKTWGSKTGAWANIAIIGKMGYLAIGTEVTEGKTTWGLYQVKEGKLSCLFNGRAAVNGGALVKGGFVYTSEAYDMFRPQKVSSSTLYVDLSLGTQAFGQMKVQGLKIVLKDGKFVLQKNPGKINHARVITKKGPGKLEAARNIVLYKTAGSTKKIGTIRKGTGFELEKAAVIQKEVYVLVNSGELRGWVKLGDKSLVKYKAMLIWG